MGREICLENKGIQMDEIVEALDNHPQVVQEREHIEAMDAADRDDF